MNSQSIKTFVMAGVLVALAGWYFGYEKNYKNKRTQSDEEAKQLTTLKSDEIQEIEIYRMKNPPEDFSKPASKPFEFDSIKLKKAGEVWSLAEPVQDVASPTEIQSMLSSLTTTKQERIVSEKSEKLESYGLNPAIIKVLAKKNSTDKGEEFFFGTNTAVGFSAYAKTGTNSSVYKIPRSLKNNFDKEANALRHKNVVTVTQPTVTEIEIQTTKENVVLTKGEKDRWVLSRDNMPAETTEVIKSLAGVVDLQAKAFVSDKAEDLKKYGLDKPVVRVWLKNGDKNRTLVLIGKIKDTVYAKREDRAAIVEVDKAILDKLERSGTAYRSLALAQFNRYDVKRIKLERKGENVELVKDSKWTFINDAKTIVDESKVDTLLAALQDTKVEKFLTGKNKTSDPVLTIHLYEKTEPTEKEKIFLSFSKKGTEIIGSRSDLNIGFTLKAADFEKLNLKKETFIKVEDKAADTKATPQKPS